MSKRSHIVVITLLVVAGGGALVASQGGRLYTALLRMHGIREEHPPRAAASASEDVGEWPATPLGALARQWTEAFSSGEPAMRQVLPQLLTAESFAKRDLETRLESYRGLHERFGSLMLSRVDSLGADEIRVTLIASDMSQHGFVFTAAPGPPYRLERIALIDRQHGGGSH